MRRRRLLGILVLATTSAACAILTVILSPDRISPLEVAILILFAILFSWICTAFWIAVCGYCACLRGDIRGRGPPISAHDASRRAAFLRRPTRIAIVMPICNEDTTRVFARLRAMYRSLVETGEAPRFDVFVLSDTSDPEIWVAEELGWNALCRDVRGWGRIFYRHRDRNVGHKSGNVADFCRRWGRRYDYLIVLDADSLMSGRVFVELARRMDYNPRVGLIQTPPVPVNGETLFARLQQFAASVYGPVFAAGSAFWHLGDGNYWGHNAIIRVAPFIQHCGLPKLPSAWPSGSEILSHDFVEAAMLRRAGWEVWLAADLTESYEEPPPTLAAYAKRDRRWCQGNLQHLRLLAARGFHPMNRLHLAMGGMSYLASPLWLLFVLCSAAEVFRRTFAAHDYFPSRSLGLFPAWPASHVVEASALLAITLVLLFLPKFFGLHVLARRLDALTAHGGIAAATIGVVLESLLSILIAPILMALHTRFVVTTLFGGRTQWTAQQRTSTGTPLREALRSDGAHGVVGIAAGIVSYHFIPNLFWWLSPVLAGLVLAVPLNLVLGSVAVGRWLRAAGVLSTAGETVPPAVIRTARTTCVEPRPPRGAPGDGASWVTKAIFDPFVNGLHIVLLPPASRSAGERLRLKGLVQTFVEHGLEALSPDERRALLSDAASMMELHALAWRSPASKAASG